MSLFEDSAIRQQKQMCLIVCVDGCSFYWPEDHLVVPSAEAKESGRLIPADAYEGCIWYAIGMGKLRHNHMTLAAKCIQNAGILY
jgi:hypothetical protein